jgi:hypothetical protein
MSRIKKVTSGDDWCELGSLPLYTRTASFKILLLKDARKLGSSKADFKTSNVLIVVDQDEAATPLLVFRPSFAFWKDEAFLVHGIGLYSAAGKPLPFYAPKPKGATAGASREMLDVAMALNTGMYIYVKEVDRGWAPPPLVSRFMECMLGYRLVVSLVVCLCTLTTISNLNVTSDSNCILAHR